MQQRVRIFIIAAIYCECRLHKQHSEPTIQVCDSRVPLCSLEKAQQMFYSSNLPSGSQVQFDS